jgi:sulfide:quinone oxidoreductase
MRPAVVSDVLAVGEVPTIEQISILATAGFRTLICNQPDGEVDRLLPSTDMAGEAERHGLVFRYIPLASRTPPPEELAAFAGALKELPAPIYACCYSGARSAAACALILARQQEVADITSSFAKAGFDISGLKVFLEGEHDRAMPASGRSNGASRDHDRGSANPAPAAEAPAPALPTYKPVIVLPRASSAGGFAM